jgi:eukaryotic-like serine/threonine-protein kinase
VCSSDLAIIHNQSSLLSAPLVMDNGMLYVTTLEGVVAGIKTSDGSVAWQKPTNGRLWSTPAILKDVLYVGNMEGKILAISTKDGSVVWEQNAGSSIIGGGVVLTDAVVFPTEGGSLVAWDLNGQKQLWTQAINGSKLYTTPVIAGDSLVAAVTGGDKLLQAYSLSGQASWSFVMPK